MEPQPLKSEDSVAEQSDRLSPYRDRRGAVVLVLVLGIVTGGLETATILGLVALIEGLSSTRDELNLEQLGIDATVAPETLLIAVSVSLVAMTAGQVSIAWVRARNVARWQLEVQTRAIRAFLASSSTEQSADTSAALQTLVNRARVAAQGLRGLMSIAAGAGTLAVFLVGALAISPISAIAMIAAGAGLLALLRPLRTASERASAASTLAHGAIADSVDEIHTLAQEIRLHNASEVTKVKISSELEIARAAQSRAAFLTGIGGVVYRSAGLALILVAGVLATRRDSLDAASLGAVGLLLLRSLGYGQQIQGARQTMRNSDPYIALASEAIVKYESAVPERGTRTLNELGGLELRNVDFEYSPGVPALSGVSFEISPGESLGIIGPSGSGKSTLAQVLLGVRDPTRGSYLVAKAPVHEIAPEDWFDRIAVVPQQPRLLTGTVSENVAFLRPHIGQDAIEAAAKSAGLHSEITQLPNGYDTVMGGAHRDLSGGQRQRLGIARALAGAPDLLVLDEPTSALDAISETLIQQVLSRLHGTVTVVVISHRLSTLKLCDRLLVLENGKVGALGRPEEVLESSHFYRMAIELQDASSSSKDQST